MCDMPVIIVFVNSYLYMIYGLYGLQKTHCSFPSFLLRITWDTLTVRHSVHRKYSLVIFIELRGMWK
jgi:hypothetical protein